MHFGIWKFIVVGKEDYRVIIISSTVGMHKTVRLESVYHDCGVLGMFQ